ncbi:hypothetical protein EJB05_45248, partial [Eragrostis curvula]
MLWLSVTGPNNGPAGSGTYVAIGGIDAGRIGSSASNRGTLTASLMVRLRLRSGCAHQSLPGRQTEKRDAGRVVQRQGRRLRPGQAHRRRPAVAHHGLRWHNGPGVRARRENERGVRRVASAPSSRSPAAGGARGRGRIGPPGAVWVWESYGGGSVLDATDARLDGEFDARWAPLVRAPGTQPPADHPAGPSTVNVLQFEVPPQGLPPRMPVATYGPTAGCYSSATLSAEATAGGCGAGRSTTTDEPSN